MAAPSVFAAAGLIDLSLVVVLLDQYTKILVAGGFRLWESRPVTSFLNVVYYQNTGAAWSIPKKRSRNSAAIRSPVETPSEIRKKRAVPSTSPN